jgi:UDP-N-acetylmuramate--alanine ligase
VSGELLVGAVAAARPDLELHWAPGLDDVVALLATELRDGDLCMTVGAGDVTTLADRVIVELQARPAPGTVGP